MVVVRSITSLTYAYAAMAESIFGVSSNPTPPPVPAPAPDHKNCVDEAEEEVLEEMSAASTRSTTVSSLNIDELTINENKKATKEPSKIQDISLPMILSPSHEDLIAQAHNVSGKICFVLGMLSRVDPEGGFKDDSLRIMKEIQKVKPHCQANLVINCDLPVKHTAEYAHEPEPDYEVYLHRVGGAGRFGHKGSVFNLICGGRDKKLMTKIEKHFGTHLTEVNKKTYKTTNALLRRLVYCNNVKLQ